MLTQAIQPVVKLRRSLRRRHWAVRLAAATAFTFTLMTLIGAWVIRNVLPFSIIRPSRSERLAVYGGRTPASVGLESEEFWTEAARRVWLKGWFIRAKSPGPARGTVVLLHGSSSCKEAMLGQAELLADEGYQTILYDSRAHGESGGEWATYGFYERRDFSRVLDAAEQRFGGQKILGSVAIFGSSYGGAVALQAMAEDGRVRCAVVECAFADLRETLRHHGRLWFGVPGWMSDLALARAARLAKFDPAAVHPEAAAARIRRPVLLIHGTADPRIPLAEGERIFRQLQAHAPSSEWYPVFRGGHEGLWQAGGEEYRARLLRFLDQHTRAEK